MTTLVIPEFDAEPWPTLGPQVCQFIESELVFGPGDLRAQPARLDDEKRGLIYRAYEIYPAGHKNAGRRRFKRVALSLRKGTAKTELAAWIAATELHPDAPVRFGGWDASGNPVGIAVQDPYIPMVAYTEEQTEDLAYYALYVILSEGPLANDFDIGLGRIMRKAGDGKAVALASAPDARDGARTTFQHFDETHRFTLPRLIESHQTMQANIPKRKLADPWSLETTTAPVPGEGSVAERTMDYAESIRLGKTKDPRLFFFHRQASDDHDLTDEAGVRAAVLEASGPTAEWSDIDSIVELWRDPQTDRSYFERVWLNRPKQSANQAFSVAEWHRLKKKGRYLPEPGSLITIGFDGSRWMDSTALVGTEIETGFMWILGVWERPKGIPDWEVPEDQVTIAVDGAFETYDVWRMYCDPPYWESTIAHWAGTYGEAKVISWDTRRQRQMAYACRGFESAIRSRELSHSGELTLESHVGNARRNELNLLDDQGERLWTIRKERRDSSAIIDLATAAILSWEARTDAVSAGVGPTTSIYEQRGLVTI